MTDAALADSVVAASTAKMDFNFMFYGVMVFLLMIVAISSIDVAGRRKRGLYSSALISREIPENNLQDLVDRSERAQ